MNHRRNSRRTMRNFQPRLGRLEDRMTPAGNVTAVVSGGILTVVGDAAANQIWIAGAGNTSAVIRAVDSTTTINGQTGPVTLDGITVGFNISTGAGDDVLVMSGLNAWKSLTIDMGAGNDAVNMFGVYVWRDATIGTGAGNDGLQIVNSRFYRYSGVDMGDDHDAIIIGQSLFYNNTYIGGGTGFNTLTADNSQFLGFVEKGGFTNVFVPPTPPDNTPPTANNDTGTVTRGASTTINVAANDVANTGTLNLASIVVTSPPTAGTAAVNINGTITYTSNSASTATTDTFRYTIKDSAGNTSNEATVTVTITNNNQTGATVTISSPVSSPTKTTPIPFRVAFSKDIASLSASAITVTNGTVADIVRLGGNTFQVSINATADGPVSVSIAAGAVLDTSGIGNQASNVATVVLDRVAPVVTTNTLTTNDPTPTITGTINDPTARISVDVGGQLIIATITGNTWSATLTEPLDDGTYDIIVTARDTAGNESFGDQLGGLIIDTVAPVATISTTASDPTGTAPIPFTVTFDEDVTGFTAAGISVTNGTVMNFTAVDAQTYTFDVTPTTDGDVTVTVAAGAAQDDAGNENEEATFTIRFESGNPIATISTTASDPTNLAVIPFMVTFSEDVTGFEIGDIQVANGTVSNFVAVDARHYTFDITPDADGLITITIPADSATDSEGNGNPEATFTITSDRTAPPAPVITGLDPSTDGGTQGDGLTNNNMPTIVGTAEAGTTVEVFADSGSGPVSLGTTVVDANGDWRFTPTTALADGMYTITAKATDAAGNVSDVSNEFELTIDTVAPVATITTTEPDPTSANVIPFTVTFDKDVTGFTAAGITIGNGTLSNFVAVDARTYTFDVAPTTNGLVTVTIAADAATDAAGNGVAETVFSITSDRFLATITTLANDPTNLAVIPFTVVFTRDASGFEVTDLIVTNGTVSNFTMVDARTYTFDVTPTADGLVTIQIAAGSVEDPDGNPIVEANFSITSDRTAPDAPVITGLDPASDTGTPGDGITNDNTPTIIGTGEVGTTIEIFADSGSGNVSLGTTVVGADGNWSFTPTTELADGTYTITATATDAAGNISPVSNSISVTIDTVRPTTALTTTASDPTNLDVIPFTVVFGKDVTGFEIGDIVVTNGTVSNFVMVDARTYTFDVTPAGDGLVTVSVPAGAAQDLAGNDSEAAELSITSERFNPVATITTTASDPTNLAVIPFTVTFSEDVTGFEVSDLSVQNGVISNFVMVDARTYTFDVTPTADGLVTVKVAAGAVQDGAGNTNAEATFTITSDQTAPAAPTITGLDPASDSGTAGDGITNVNMPTIIGTADAGTTVTVYADSGSGPVILGTVVAAGNGIWSFTVTTALADGVYSITATATDAAGNVSGSSAAFSLTIDTAAPVATIATTATDPTNLAVIPFTVTFNEDVTGFSEAGLNVTNGTVSNFVMVDARTYTFDVTPTADGLVTVKVNPASASDVAGNQNVGAQFSITSDRTAPFATILANSTGVISGTAGDALSGVATVRISLFNGAFYWDGNGFNSTTEIFLDVTTSDGYANWSYVFPKTGTYTVHAQVTDLAGNVFDLTQSVTLP